MKRFYLGPFVSGILFAMGLGISGMTEPKKIISFLDITGDWDPALIFVMVGAVAIYTIAFHLIKKISKPLCEKKFFIPNNKEINRNILIGSSLFGVGWGLTGLCPGPGFVSIVNGSAYSIVFIVSLIVGVGIHHILSKN